MNFDQVVSTTIYLDDSSESPLFAKVYKKYFSGILPAQATLQQIPLQSEKRTRKDIILTSNRCRSSLCVRGRTRIRALCPDRTRLNRCGAGLSHPRRQLLHPPVERFVGPGSHFLNFCVLKISSQRCLFVPRQHPLCRVTVS